MEILPLNAIVYNQDKVGMEEVIAPPYDVIDEKYQDELYSRSDYNCVRLILTKGANRYEDAKNYFLKAYELNNNEESLKGYFMVFASQNDSITIKQEMRKYELGDDNFENLMLEIGDANDDVREMTIYSMLQRAIYNRMNKDMIDYDKRMDIILGQLKDEFREQAI